MNKILIFILTVCLSASFLSCKKDKELTDPEAKLSFSQDSVLFDTVFTTIGSTTRNIRVINNNNQKVKISSVRLAKGQTSNFILNVDGTPGKEVRDVEILANDSIYIFIQVNVDPTNQNSPLIIQDNILFELNGNQQSVALEAWGQDAYYHYPTDAIQFKNGFLAYSRISSNNNAVVTWNNDKPHVIYGWLVADSTQTLIINQGVRVYFHQNAGLWVYRYGKLQVNGVLGNEVTFQGDRREADYADLPGQWDRIWINEGSTGNSINYAIIKNSYMGIQASMYPFFVPPNSITYDFSAPKKLRLTNTIIKNCSSIGLYTTFFNVWAANNSIVNCKEYCYAHTLGGNSTLIHNTFANYFTQDGGRGGQPTVHVDNYDGANIWETDSVYFVNNIIEGSQGAELELDIRQSSSANQKVIFNKNLIRGSISTNTLIVNTNNLFNGNPNFEDVGNYNFKIGASSSAVNLSDANVLAIYPFLNTDIKGSSRGSNPDAGSNQH